MPHRGGCLCGAVSYEVAAKLENVVACHCSQCSRISGNFAAMVACRKDELHVSSADALSWFRSSAQARRGFCKTCGSSLFWEASTGDDIYVTAGSLDRPTGLTLKEHIFVGSKADFYELHDDLPKKAEW